MRAAVTLLALAVSGAANATLTLCVGPSGCTIQGDGVENVLFPSVGDTGLVLTGSTNQTNTLIDFTSTEQMVITGGGQGNEVPLPAAAWLFGSGLLGLTGVARRRAKADGVHA